MLSYAASKNPASEFISIHFNALTFTKWAGRKQNSVIVKSQLQIPSSIVFNGELFLNLSQLAQSEMFYSLKQSPHFKEMAKYLLQEMHNTRRTDEKREKFNYLSNRLLMESNNFLFEPSSLLLEPSNFLLESSNLIKQRHLVF